MISIDKAAILISLLFAFNKYLRFAVDGFFLETTCYRRTHSCGLLRRDTSKTVYLLRFNNSHSGLRRFLSTQPPPSPSDDTIVDYTQEETLLCISMTTQPGITLNDALLCISKFCQTFPFAAVLPVQPLFYIPMKDDGGVEIRFLRKKTPDRSGVDGGIRFFLRSAVPDGNDDDNNYDTANYDPSCSNNGEQPNNRNPSPIVELIAKRNSNGQVITKIIAEKLVITNFVASFMAKTDTTTGTTTSTVTTPNEVQLVSTTSSPVNNVVHVKSMYHKWM
jgi:hypothetical protein